MNLQVYQKNHGGFHDTHVVGILEGCDGTTFDEVLINTSIFLKIQDK